MILAHGGDGASLGGSAEAGWEPLLILLGAFVLVVAALAFMGRSRDEVPRVLVPLMRIADSLERVTGIPGWAVTMAGTSLFGLLLAGVGFYRDVAYHIAYGRDEILFTAPHTEIFLGLMLIFVAPLLGIAVASVDRVEAGFRLKRIHVPWSALPLLALGLGAVSGFPIDEIWHQAFGVDVTMWSPPHLLMILGAAFSGAATWLVIAEARVETRGWGRTAHVLCGVFTLLGINATLAEFGFGVPQWQQLYHPVISLIGAGVALVAARLVLGRGGALGVAVTVLLIGFVRGLELVPAAPVELRQASAMIGSAIAVEIAALLVGTRSTARFAAASAFGIATLGLGVEWLWNSGAPQPWTSALLPEILIVGTIAAAAAAVLGAGLGTIAVGRPAGMHWGVFTIAAVGIFVALAIPFPRTDSEVSADVTFEESGTDEVVVMATVDPVDAVEDARWFQALAWQGGERVIAQMERTGEGEYRADRPIPIDGMNKSMIRLQRGSEMVAIPIRFPEDPEIGADEIVAESRAMQFEDEKAYLQREVEAHEAGAAWLRPAISGFFGATALLWVAAFAFTAVRLSRRH